MKLKSIVLMFAILASPAFADPIEVSYTVTGSTGDWTLDFTVTNNLIGFPYQSFYFFGVDLSATNITGIPTDDEWGNYAAYNSATPWTNAPYGGSSIPYNNVWIDQDEDTASLPPGSTTTGFDVTISDTVAPTSVDWFAYTDGLYNAGLDPDPYTGGGNFYIDDNPGFEGVASIASTSAVPEPSTYLLTLIGLGLLGLMRKRIVPAFR